MSSTDLGSPADAAFRDVAELPADGVVVHLEVLLLHAPDDCHVGRWNHGEAVRLATLEKNEVIRWWKQHIGAVEVERHARERRQGAFREPADAQVEPRGVVHLPWIRHSWSVHRHEDLCVRDFRQLRDGRTRVEDCPGAADAVDLEYGWGDVKQFLPNADAVQLHVVVGRVLRVCEECEVFHVWERRHGRVAEEQGACLRRRS